MPGPRLSSPTEGSPDLGTVGSEEHRRGVRTGAAHTQTWSTTGQSEVFGDLQDFKLQTKLELSQPQQETSRPSSLWILSSSPRQLLAVWFVVQFASLKASQSWTEMGMGTREGESWNPCPLPLSALVGSGKFPKLFTILLCWKTAANKE